MPLIRENGVIARIEALTAGTMDAIRTRMAESGLGCTEASPEGENHHSRPVTLRVTA